MDLVKSFQTSIWHYFLVAKIGVDTDTAENEPFSFLFFNLNPVPLFFCLWVPCLLQAPTLTGRNSLALAAPDVSRAAEPQMAESIRDLRDRVGTVKNTKKITSAMKLVAAAKVLR